MKIRIRVETEFGWGETRSHDLCTIERGSTGVTDEDLGLSLSEGKSLLMEIQRVLLQEQVEEISEVSEPLPALHAEMVAPGRSAAALAAATKICYKTSDQIQNCLSFTIIATRSDTEAAPP